MDAPRKIRLPRFSRRSLLPSSWLDWALAVLCVAVVVFAVSSIGGSSSGAAATERTVTAGRGVVQATVSGNGSLEPAQQVELSFGASGEVTAIYVKAGERVSKGEILARVDASSARASLASARASLTEAEETLEAAEEAAEEETSSAAYYGAESTTVLADYLSGASEAEGEVTSPEGEEAAEGGTEKSGSESGSKTKSESKDKSESTSTAPSGEEERSSTSEGTEAASEPSGGSEESGGSVGGGTVSVATAEAQVREARLSVRSAENEVAETTLRAPFAGTVASISGEVGETVSGGSSSSSSGGAVGGTGSTSSGSSAFIVLSQLEQLKLEVSFSESDIGKVKVGQTATVSIDSMEGTELAGKVTKVNVLPSEGGSTGVVEYPATILLTQSAKGLRAGMSASAEVVVEQVKNAVTVPSEALSSGPTGKTLTVKNGNGKEVTKRVTTGLVGDELTQIVSGLKAGETVVLPEVTVATGGSGSGESNSSSAAAGGFPGGGGGFPSGGPPSGGGFPGG